MNKLIFSVRSAVLVAVAAVAGSIFFLSCQKENHDSVNIPVAGIMTFNLSPDKNAIGFSLSGSNLNSSPMGYPNYSGNYISIYPGQRSVDAYDFYSPGAFLASTLGNFDSAKYYSAFLIGAGGKYRNVVVNDNFDSLSGVSGQAYIRYINAIPDSVNVPTITIVSNGNTVTDNTSTFGTVSQFSAVNPGNITIGVKNNNTIDTNRTISVEQRKVYTILLTGVPGSSSTPVEIKYVANGVLDSVSKASTSGISGSSLLK